jgi:hypothetical protein
MLVCIICISQAIACLINCFDKMWSLGEIS